MNLAIINPATEVSGKVAKYQRGTIFKEDNVSKTIQKINNTVTIKNAFFECGSEILRASITPNHVDKTETKYITITHEVEGRASIPKKKNSCL